MIEIISIPQTPREAYIALVGKRRDLLLAAGRGQLNAGVMERAGAREQFAIFSAPLREPHVVFLGGCN